MKIYNYDNCGVFLGWSEADPDPLEPCKFLLPARATFFAPSPHQKYFYDGKWSEVKPVYTEADMMAMELKDIFTRFCASNICGVYLGNEVILEVLTDNTTS